MSKLAEQILHWRFQPADFVRDALNAEPDPWQVDALNALVSHGKVSIRSAHGPGKTALDSWAILWFISTHFPCRIPCTAPTFSQLHDVLWSELGNWYGRMHPSIKGQLQLTSDRLAWKAAPQESFAVARTARTEQPEALQGFHSENLLFIIDEASGVDEKIFEVAEGALTEPHAKQLLTSNPTRNAGYFFDSHHRMRHRFHCMKVGYMDSPRISAQYVEDMRQKYGEESNVFRVRVLGEFPLVGDDQVIPLELVEAAVKRDVEQLEVKPVWGLDVARFGSDKTALAKRQGNCLLEPVKTWQGLDLMATCGRVVDAYDECSDLERPERIFVDTVGIGAGVKDRLRELDLPVIGVNVAEVPLNRSRFMRRRDELYWKMRSWFDGRDVTMPDDRELVAELTAPVYKMLSTGKIQVESKDEMKRRGVNSPDRSDALMLTFAERSRKAERAVRFTYRREKRMSRGTDLGWIA